jgi:hypothetical protein
MPADLVDGIARACDVIGLSYVTDAEVRDSLAKANREGATRKANLLSQSWDRAEHPYASRMLSFAPAAAHPAGMHGQGPRLRPHAWFCRYRDSGDGEPERCHLVDPQRPPFPSVRHHCRQFVRDGAGFVSRRGLIPDAWHGNHSI